MVTRIDNSTIEHVTKPWGSYDTYFVSPNNSVKFKGLFIDPGHQLSLQYHSKRKEVWYIDNDCAVYKITIGDKTEILSGKRQFEIPRGERHTIMNLSSIPLIIYEMQIGECLESDIVRLHDPYNRN